MFFGTDIIESISPLFQVIKILGVYFVKFYVVAYSFEEGITFAFGPGADIFLLDIRVSGRISKAEGLET